MISSRLPTDIGVPLRSSTFNHVKLVDLKSVFDFVYLASLLFVLLLLGLQPLLVPDELLLHQQVVLDPLLLQKPQTTLNIDGLNQESQDFLSPSGVTLVWGVTPGSLLAASGPFTLFLFLPTLVHCHSNIPSHTVDMSGDMFFLLTIILICTSGSIVKPGWHWRLIFLLLLVLSFVLSQNSS